MDTAASAPYETMILPIPIEPTIGGVPVNAIGFSTISPISTPDVLTPVIMVRPRPIDPPVTVNNSSLVFVAGADKVIALTPIAAIVVPSAVAPKVIPYPTTAPAVLIPVIVDTPISSK